MKGKRSNIKACCGACTFGRRQKSRRRQQLVEPVIDHARAYVEVIQLSVISDNQPARRLYGSLGFVEYGLERDSLKQNGRYYDEILMALDLKLDLDQYALPSAHTGAAFREELTPSSVE